MRTLAAALFASLVLAGCAEDTDPENLAIPGVFEPRCSMTWRSFRITSVDLPDSSAEATANGFDLDQRRNDGIDNTIGTLMSSMRVLFPESWDPETAFNARLSAGGTFWVVEVGTCRDGSEGRVVSARATDVDGDGVLEIVDRGVAAVGTSTTGQAAVTGVRGLGWMPVGGLFGASPTAATEGWQAGLALTADVVASGDVLVGRLGIGLNPDTEAVLTPVQNFFNERLAAGTSQGARDMDTNHDGTIDFAENRRMVLGILTLDLDLGECDSVECYAPFDPDGIADHASLGFGVRGTAVELE